MSRRHVRANRQRSTELNRLIDGEGMSEVEAGRAIGIRGTDDQVVQLVRWLIGEVTNEIEVTSSPRIATSEKAVCDRKKKYSSHAMAMRSYSRHHAKNVRAYQCPHCHAWHVSTTKKKGGRPRRGRG